METTKQRLDRMMQNPEFRKMMDAEIQAEFNSELTAAFGKGVTVVNIVTGKKTITK